MSDIQKVLPFWWPVGNTLAHGSVAGSTMSKLFAHKCLCHQTVSLGTDLNLEVESKFCDALAPCPWDSSIAGSKAHEREMSATLCSTWNTGVLLSYLPSRRSWSIRCKRPFVICRKTASVVEIFSANWPTSATKEIFRFTKSERKTLNSHFNWEVIPNFFC